VHLHPSLLSVLAAASLSGLQDHIAWILAPTAADREGKVQSVNVKRAFIFHILRGVQDNTFILSQHAHSLQQRTPAIPCKEGVARE
jgi:hypothetical protein